MSTITLPAKLHAAGANAGACGIVLHLRLQYRAPEFAKQVVALRQRQADSSTVNQPPAV